VALAGPLALAIAVPLVLIDSAFLASNTLKIPTAAGSRC
jgi:hypothetical protein